MKKIVAVLSLLLAMGIGMLLGVGAMQAQAVQQKGVYGPKTEDEAVDFDYVGEVNGACDVLYHKDTGVMYLYHWRGGGICVMVDADGKPLIWKE